MYVPCSQCGKRKKYVDYPNLPFRDVYKTERHPETSIIHPHPLFFSSYFKRKAQNFLFRKRETKSNDMP